MTPHMTQQELCNAIYRAVHGSKQPMSRREIADAVGRKKVPHVVNMIEHLVATGYFKREVTKTKFGMDVFVYKVEVFDQWILDGNCL